MYHRARAGRHGNAPSVLDAHFAHIANCFHPVLPGDSISKGPTSVCLSFDDGYFDFYHTVFPLLVRHNLKALLAVPVNVVTDQTSVPVNARLAVESEVAFSKPETGGFCTWSELERMTASGRVRIAAHGNTHVRLDGPSVDTHREIRLPQSVLEARLGQPVDSFVFPYGRFSSDSLHVARRCYTHVFRIGGAINCSWGAPVLYRVDADEMKSPHALFHPGRMLQYRARYLWNRLRHR